MWNACLGSVLCGCDGGCEAGQLQGPRLAPGAHHRSQRNLRQIRRRSQPYATFTETPFNPPKCRYLHRKLLIGIKSQCPRNGGLDMYERALRQWIMQHRLCLCQFTHD